MRFIILIMFLFSSIYANSSCKTHLSSLTYNFYKAKYYEDKEAYFRATLFYDNTIFQAKKAIESCSDMKNFSINPLNAYIEASQEAILKIK